MSEITAPLILLLNGSFVGTGNVWANLVLGCLFLLLAWLVSRKAAS